MTSVRVVARFRPFNKRELEEYQSRELTVKIDFQDRKTLVITQPGMPKQVFNFDCVFDPKESQKTVFEEAARSTVMDVLNGFNGTIFAYGQTGAGKSFTMLGPELGDPALWGIIPRASECIFQAISEDTSGTEFTLKCSYLEIYKEMINDLLDPKKKNLSVHEHPTRGVYIDNLTEEVCSVPLFMLPVLTSFCAWYFSLSTASKISPTFLHKAVRTALCLQPP
jgi:kinesin family protein 5